jgi:ubiquinone/menaquinone biosynthesis C-methylase UbiE
MVYSDDGVGWHSSIASTFDSKYCRSRTFVERYGIWTRLVARYSDPKSRVLDVGCGTGVFSFFAAKHNREVIGVDGSDEMIAVCRRKIMDGEFRNVSFLRTDVMSLHDVVSGKMDLIICSSVLEYLDDVHGAIRVIVSLLKEGGILLCSMPNKSSLYRFVERLTYQVSKRPRYYRFVRTVCRIGAFGSLLEENNLKIEDRLYCSRTPILSHVLRPLGLAKYSDNLFIVVAKRS